MRYEELCVTLLDHIFGISVWDDFLERLARVKNSPPNSNRDLLEGFSEGGYGSSLSIISNLTELELQRIKWGFWALQYVICLEAWVASSQLLDLEPAVVINILRARYQDRIPRDDAVIIVGDYLPSRGDVRALKKSRAVPSSFFTRLDTQLIARGVLAVSLADHRVSQLSTHIEKGVRLLLISTGRNANKVSAYCLTLTTHSPFCPRQLSAVFSGW